MKHKFISLMTIWLCYTAAAMADKLVISNTIVPQGGAIELPINFVFDTNAIYVGFQLNLDLPTGISTVKDEDGLPFYTKNETSIDKITVLPTENDGFGSIPQTASATIKGTEGTLITITLQADADLNIGDVMTAAVTNAMLTSKDDEGVMHSVLLDDFTFTITIGEPDDGRIKFSENSTSLPSYTAGDKGDVKMTRTITAGQWSTLVLPFTLTKAKAEAAFGSDVELAEFSGFEVEYADEDDVTPDAITINFSTYTMTAKKGITGGKPFLIKTTKDIESFEADDVTLFNAVTDVTKSDEYDTNGKFTGCLVKTTVPADGLFINNNQFWYSTGKTNIKAFRCWFELGAVLDKETDFGAKVRFFVNDMATDIDGISAMPMQTDAVYSVSGVRMSANGNLAKGLYIVNGKKVLVK